MSASGHLRSSRRGKPSQDPLPEAPTPPESASSKHSARAAHLARTVVIIVALGFGCWAGDALGQQALYVDDDAPLGGDGLTWESALCYLQDALEAAADSGGTVTEIRVAQGVYHPDEGVNQIPGDRAATFELLDGLALRGGYAGVTEPNPDARDIALYETILSGDLIGDDGPDFANNDENAYHVLVLRRYGYGPLPTCLIEGFTVMGGNANGEPYDLLGGGLLTNALPVVSACTFTANSAESGGAIAANGWSYLDVLTIERCRFEQNRSFLYGGAVYVRDWAVLKECVFVENSCATPGRAASAPRGGEPRQGPRCDQSGGALFARSFTTVVACTFARNDAANHGGAIMFYSYRNSCLNSRFTANTAGFTGGACSSFFFTLYASCLFSGNRAGSHGGGIEAARYAYLLGCSFIGNWAGVGAGGLNAEGSALVLRSCVFWSNLDPTGLTESAQFTAWSEFYLPDVLYSCIQGLDGLAGYGNLGDYPQFVEAGAWDTAGTPEDYSDDSWIEGDYHLMPNSPCINVGSNYPPEFPWPNILWPPPLSAEDLDGAPRIQNCRTEMGAFESPWMPAEYADCNANGLNDDCDVFELASRDCDQNHVPDECEQCGDLDGDNDVDQLDFGLLLDAFGTGAGDSDFDPCADFDADGAITFLDFQAWLQCYYSYEDDAPNGASLRATPPSRVGSRRDRRL